jgi:hypothetical protein
MKPLRGCSGITKHACTQPWAISAQSSSNNSGIEAQKRSQVNRFQNQKQATNYNYLWDTDSEGKVIVRGACDAVAMLEEPGED